jgi:hypothetical protein
MGAAKPAGVSEKHLLLFGTIVQNFAAHELLIARIMAHVLGTQVPAVLLLTRTLSFEEKRKALLDLLRHLQAPLDQYDCVNSFLSFLLPFVRLRYDIVHSTWRAAPTPAAIQPAWILNPPARISPVHAEADSLPGDFVEDEEERLAYSVDELAEIAASIEKNFAKFSAYVDRNGLAGHEGSPSRA